MPIENEIKYIIDVNISEEEFSDWEKIYIKQGYLKDGPRIRKYNEQYLFTYKKWIDEEGVLLEIETVIDEVDFNRLWNYCDVKLSKNRFVLNIGDIEWCVDFLKDNDDKTYFVISEAEMPEDMKEPEEIIEIIRDNIVFIPQRNDEEFTNKNLADITKAREIYGKINM